MKNSFLPCGTQLNEWLKSQGEKPFRLKQIRDWVFQSRISEWSEMTNLPQRLRGELSSSFEFWTTEIARIQESKDGTQKILLSLFDFEREKLQTAAGDGESLPTKEESIGDNGGRSAFPLIPASAGATSVSSQVECVLLRDGIRRTICVSSQVGCAMGCVFCASGLDGVKRNLTSGEIVEQMLRLQQLLPEEERLSHIVMMGMGEPLANLDNVLAALDIATSPEGLGISPRRVTISTVGIPGAIERLAKHGKPYNLAVSLHAPNDQLRSELVPVNNKIGIKGILAASEEYFEISRRRITFEYVLLDGVNDSDECAEELAQLLRGRSALMNVIPYNPVEGLPWKTPLPKRIACFEKILKSNGINVQFRVRKGDEISAACGQLRRKTQSQTG